MIKNYKILILVFLFFSLFACKSKDNLSLNLEEGFSYTLDIYTHFEGEQTLMGQTQVTNSDLHQLLVLKIINADNDQYTAEMTFSNMSLNVHLNVGTLTIDGNNPDENPISHVFANMDKFPLKIGIDPIGRITILDDLDKYFDKIINQSELPGLSLEEKIEVKNQLLEQFNERYIRGQIELFTKVAPNKKVKKGYKWSDQTEHLTQVGGSLKNNYELVGEEEDFWIVELVGNLSPNKKENPIMVNGYETKFRMKGTLKGEFKLDKRTGWPVKASINENYNGDLLMQINNKETKVPALIKLNTELKEVVN